MTIIILEKCYGPRLDPRTGKMKETYLGYIGIPTELLTPELLAALKADKEDKHGWKKYRKVMKDAGYDIGEVEPI